MAFAAVPAARLASKVVAGTLGASANFASYLAGSSTAEPASGIANDGGAENYLASFDQLLPQLQEFLKSLGADEKAPVELKSDGQDSLEVSGDPVVKQAVESWLKQNATWTESWQTAVRQFFADSPTGSPGSNSRWTEKSNPPSLRSKIGVSDVEHWQSIL